MPDGEVLRQRIKRPVQWIALTFTIYQLVVASGVLTLHMLVHRGIHLAFILGLALLTIPPRSGKKEHPFWFFLDLVLAGAGIIVNLYVAILNQYFPDVVKESAGVAEGLQVVLGIIAMLLVLEATRRIIGPILSAICVFFVVYAVYSNLFPGFMAGRGFTLGRVTGAMYLWIDGIYGVPLGIAATEVFMFVVFASFFAASGVGDAMMKTVTGFFGAVRGGPAKVAIVASGFFGTLSGSAVANVMTTGAVTIPMMKRLGYKPEFAGAVEAVASTGGMFMPPVMAAAAFVMAEYLQVPFGQVALAAALPGILYYLALYFAIDLEAVKTGLTGMPRDQLPDWKLALKQGWHLILPLILLIYLLIALNYPPSKAGFYSVLAIIAVAGIRKHTRMSFQQIKDALIDAAMNAVQVSVACAAVGIIIGSVTLTGLAVNLSSGLIELSGGNLLLLLILTMVVSIILGLGVTPTVIYITLAIMVAPALVDMGVTKMGAHMFVLYYGVLGMITPPVAIASFAAAGLAGAPPMRTGFVAWRLGLTAFILPFMWVYGPALLWQGTAGEIILTAISATIGVWSLAAGLQGWALKEAVWWERAILLAASLLLIKPGLWTDLSGFGLLALILAEQWIAMRRTRTSNTQKVEARG